MLSAFSGRNRVGKLEGGANRASRSAQSTLSNTVEEALVKINWTEHASGREAELFAITIFFSMTSLARDEQLAGGDSTSWWSELTRRASKGSSRQMLVSG